MKTKAKTKTKTKTKPIPKLMTVTVTLQIPKDGWRKEVTRPENLKDSDLDSMFSLADMFVMYRARNEVFDVCKELFDLHYQLFIQRESLMGRRYTARLWPSIPLEARRSIYRDVGLILGYDF